MLEKKVNLKIKCRRGGSFNGAPERNAALGGSNRQDSISFNYNNYIQSSISLNSIFENLDLIEIQELSLQVDCGDSNDSTDTSIFCQMTLNGCSDYIKMFYIQNNTSIITPFPQNFLTKDNYKSPINILLTTEFLKEKIYISNMQLVIKYRELEEWEIPDASGKIRTKPTAPNILSITGDIGDRYFENSFKIDIDYTDQCNQIEARILNDRKALIYSNQYSACSQITFNSDSATFNQGEPYVVQVRLMNINGYSDWSDISNSIIKCGNPTVSIDRVYGPNVIEYSRGLYYINSTININGIFSIGLNNTTRSSSIYDMCELLIQNNINGIWNDLEHTRTSVLSGGNATLELDSDNEIENGGIDIGEYSLVRLKAIFGNKIYYSNPITLFKCPKSEITPINTFEKIKRIPISNLKINGSIISNDYTLNCNVSCYRKVMETLEPIYTITTDNNKFTLDISSFLNTKYLYGDTLVLGYTGCNKNGIYSDEVFDPVTYQISEKLNSPVIRFSGDIYTQAQYNQYYKDKIELSWDAIQPQLFPDDKITYKIYRNNELIKVTSETTYMDFPNEQTVVYCVSATNGYDEFKSDQKSKNRIRIQDRPKFNPNHVINFKSVGSLLSQANTPSPTQGSLPTKVVISFSSAQSVTTPEDELKYIMHCGYYQEDLNNNQAYCSCCELNNVVYDPIRKINDVIIDFSDFGFKPSDNIVICLTCVDRYGLESADRTPIL